MSDPEHRGGAFPLAFACCNRDPEVRRESTSGGVFTLLGKYVIERCGGAVAGAAFDDGYHVEHVIVETVQALGRLRGSKYSQSSAAGVYPAVGRLLAEGRTVLFTGTPCQVQALLNYLGGKPETLLCMDFVCHGVASERMWDRYLTAFHDRDNLREFVFKDKIKGWSKWHVKAVYAGRVKYRRGSLDPFMRSFLTDNLRPSCYACRFKGLARVSDFTVSDCWGIGEQDSALNDDRGLSALLIQNERALSVFNEIKRDLEYRLYDAPALMEGNRTAIKSVRPSPDRHDFFEYSLKKSPERALRKYHTPNAKAYAAYFVKRLLGKER